MERILVTGGAGFIGASVLRELHQKYDCVVVDDFRSGDWKNLRGIQCELIPTAYDHPDILNAIAAGKFSTVFHQAAITDTTILDQAEMLSVNTHGFGKLLEASVQSSTRVVYASSAGVYGNSPAPNQIASGEIPENVYGYSKLAMDQLARKYYDKNRAPIIGLRYFNVYGPGETHKVKTASMVYQLYLQMMAGRQPRLFKHGEQKRDFIFIADVVQANLAAMQAPRSGVCNVGTGKARSFNDMISIIGHTLDKKPDIEYFDNPYAFFQEHTEADVKHTNKLLNWSAGTSFEDGIAAYLGWLEKHPCHYH